MILEYLIMQVHLFQGRGGGYLFCVWEDKGVILLADRIHSAKSWQDLGETGKAEVPSVKELTPVKSQSVPSGQAADGSEGFGAKG